MTVRDEEIIDGIIKVAANGKASKDEVRAALFRAISILDRWEPIVAVGRPLVAAIQAVIDDGRYSGVEER